MIAPPSAEPAGLVALWEIAKAQLTGSGRRSSTLRALLISVVGAAASFLGQIVLAHSLGQAGFGTYLVALAFMNAVLVFAKLELDAASTHFLAAYAGSGQWSLAKGFSLWSRRIASVASLVVAAVGAAVVLIGWERIARRNALLPPALLAACVVLVLAAQLMLNAGQLQALRWYAASQWPASVLRPAIVAVTMSVVYLASRAHQSPSLAVLVNAGATLAAVALTARSLRKAQPDEMRSVTPALDVPRWRHAISGFVIIGLGQLILSQQADLIVIGTMVTVSDSALYGAASQFAVLVIFGQTSVSFVMAPMISELHARGEQVRLQKLLRSVFIANAAVTLPVLVGLIVLGPWLIRAYGSAFATAYPVLVILSFASAVVGIVGATAGFVLTMTGNQRLAAWIIGGSAATNLVLTVVLTTRYGIMGTATATLLATILRCVLLVVFVQKRLHLSVIPGLRVSQ
jgi:O-antigen/teichoic acid export membrane protein